jgi:hypothetical protein
MIQAQAGGEPDAGIKPVLLYKRSRAVLNHLRNGCHSHPRLDVFARILAGLAVHFRRTPD